MIARSAARAFLPPVLAAASSHALWRVSGGAERCFDSLGDAPGLVCAPGMDLAFQLLLCTALQLLVCLPLVLWVRARDRARPAAEGLRHRIRVAAAVTSGSFALVGLSVGALDRWPEVADLSLSLGFPLFLALFATVPPRWPWQEGQPAGGERVTPTGVALEHHFRWEAAWMWLLPGAVLVVALVGGIVSTCVLARRDAGAKSVSRVGAAIGAADRVVSPRPD